MIAIAIIFIIVLLAFVIGLMLILIEVIEKNDRLNRQIEELNKDNNGLCMENLALMDKLLEAGI